MTQVVKVAQDASSASQEVMAGSNGIGTQAGTLRAEVDHFLTAVREDTDEHREYEAPATAPQQRAAGATW
jgi:methyl-accepting chemotaxis protein